MTYNQYDISAPTGFNYLAGNIMPWDDYLIFKTDNYTSVAVYGTKSDGTHFQNATVRIVSRPNNQGYYYTTELKNQDVTVNITNPYYAYGNVIGVAYDLPASNNITSITVSAAVIFCALISVFRLVWGLKRGVVK